jgi:plasmid stabilization system protein ParE
MQNYKLTLAAEADLREIAQYTGKQWSKQQAIQYASTLAHTFQSIANGDVISRKFSEQFPQVHMTRCEHHCVFYLHNKDKIPYIIAVLHKRMDMLTRLVDRLSTH